MPFRNKAFTLAAALLLVIVAGFAATVFLVQQARGRGSVLDPAFNTPPVLAELNSAPAGSGTSIDIPLLKARWGLEFTPAQPDVQPPITKEQALNKAHESHPGTRQATSVTYGLGYLRNPAMIEAARQGDKVFPHQADAGLVWVLVFEGVRSTSSGPAGAPRGHSNEMNVVISATTGEDFYSFTYR